MLIERPSLKAGVKNTTLPEKRDGSKSVAAATKMHAPNMLSGSRGSASFLPTTGGRRGEFQFRPHHLRQFAFLCKGRHHVTSQMFRTSVRHDVSGVGSAQRVCLSDS